MGFFRRKERGLFEQPAAPAPAPAPVTQGPVQVVLLDTGSKKIHVIKLIREATGLGLKEGGGTDTTSMRQRVWERDGGRCVRCGAAAELQYDHIIPLARGGADSAENLQLLCADCSRAKGDSIG